MSAKVPIEDVFKHPDVLRLLGAKFWLYVRPGVGQGSCWGWDGPDVQGQPTLPRRGLGLTAGSNPLAGKISWALANGSWPTRPVRRVCETPLCTNPVHLLQEPA